MPLTHDRFTARQLDAVTDLIPLGIIRTDPLGRCLYANARWCLLTGMSASDARGDGWKRTIAPEDRERVVRKLTEGGAGASEYAEEFRLNSRDGRGRAVSSRVLPLRDAEGAAVGYVATVSDLTERYQTEDALRDLARELGDRIRELKCLIGVSHIIEGSGDSLPDIMQQTVDLLAASWGSPGVACARVTLHGGEYQTPNYRETPWRQAADVFVDGRLAGRLEVGLLAPAHDRDHRPFLLEEQGVLDAVAEQLGRTAERLVSQRVLREREQELHDRLTRLTRINVMGEMAASIAHEVNQPLAAIAAYAQGCRRLLHDGAAADPTLADALAQIASEALRAGEIIARLHHLARKRRDERMRCGINDLIRDIRALAAVDARLHDVRLQFELEESLPPIHADGVQLQQVLLNLIRNAIDAMAGTDAPCREAVVRTARDPGGGVAVSVSDCGCGLGEDVEARLFEPFFTTKETGIGMGLAMSRSIVTAHDGRMWCTRNPGGGMTFHFSLPAAPAETA